MKKLLLFLFFSVSLHSQIQISGVVKEAGTNKKIAFASIKTNTNFVFLTDADGKFNIDFTEKPSFFNINRLGYETTKIILDHNNFYTIALLQKKVSPTAAEQTKLLVEKIIDHKSTNNPLKKLQSFQFKSYNKLFITANPDSLKGKIDSVFTIKNNEKYLKKIDSSDYKFKKIITKQNLYLTEKISSYDYDGNHFKETILGTKMAGFKEPVYEYFGVNMQSFSVYDDKYELFERKYKNPVSKKFYKEYQFQILDTTNINDRKVTLVYFNLIKKNKNGLEGVLYIDNENFAVAKTIFKTTGVLKIQSFHDFEYQKNFGIWFPKSNKILVEKGENDTDIKFFGRVISYLNNDDLFKSLQKKASDFIYLFSETNHKDFLFNTPTIIKRKSILVNVREDSHLKNDNFWDDYRIRKLSAHDTNTYRILDSLSYKRKVEKHIFLGRKIIDGYLPIGVLDVDLHSLVSFNNLEGFRLGIGGKTNEKLSEVFKINWYTAYGIRDEKLKSKIDLATRIGKFSNSWLGISYTDDLEQMANTNFITDKKALPIYTSQPPNITTFYNYKTWNAYLETKIIPKTFSRWEISQSTIDPKFDYYFLNKGKLFRDYKISTASFSMQWNPLSGFMQTHYGKFEIEKKYPKFTLQFTKTLNNVLKNDFDFFKIDFKTFYEKKFIDGNKLGLLFQAGYGSGDIPITHLYNISQNSLLPESFIRRLFSIVTDNSFETMYFNEFYSSKFLYFQGRHTFKKMIISDNMKPYFSIVSRVAIGDLDNKERHLLIPIKTINKGYYESGLEINNILKIFGLGVFYRYGPNGLPRFYDNFAAKFTISVAF